MQFCYRTNVWITQGGNCQISKGGITGTIGLNPSGWPVQWVRRPHLDRGRIRDATPTSTYSGKMWVCWRPRRCHTTKTVMKSTFACICSGLSYYSQRAASSFLQWYQYVWNVQRKPAQPLGTWKQRWKALIFLARQSLLQQGRDTSPLSFEKCTHERGRRTGLEQVGVVGWKAQSYISSREHPLPGTRLRTATPNFLPVAAANQLLHLQFLLFRWVEITAINIDGPMYGNDRTEYWQITIRARVNCIEISEWKPSKLRSQRWSGSGSLRSMRGRGGDEKSPSGPPSYGWASAVWEWMHVFSFFFFFMEKPENQQGPELHRNRAGYRTRSARMCRTPRVWGGWCRSRFAHSEMGREDFTSPATSCHAAGI